MKNDAEMYVFKSISILLNLLLFIVLLVKAQYWKVIFLEKFVDIVLWLFLLLFILKATGNLFAKTAFEKFFGILALAFAGLIWSILKKVKKSTLNI